MRLGDVLRVVHGKNQKDVKDEDGKYPIYGSGGQMGWANSFICPANTVIIGRKGNINKPIYVTEPFWNVDTAFGLVAKPGLLDARFLFHFCKYFDFEKLNTTCTIPSLTRKNVESIGMFLPPFRTQKELAAQFDVILEIIVLARNQLSSLDALVKSRFAEMFGDAGWPVATVGSLAVDVRYGTSKKASDCGEYVYLRMNNMTDDGRLDLDDVKRIDLNGPELEKCRVVDGDLLFNRTNSREKVGKTVVFHEREPMVIAGYIIRVRLGDRVRPDFLATYMNLPTTKAMLRSIAKGAVHQANINSRELSAIEVPVPPKELQDRFLSFAAEVDKSRFVVRS